MPDRFPSDPRAPASPVATPQAAGTGAIILSAGTVLSMRSILAHAFLCDDPDQMRRAIETIDRMLVADSALRVPIATPPTECSFYGGHHRFTRAGISGSTSVDPMWGPWRCLCGAWK